MQAASPLRASVFLFVAIASIASGGLAQGRPTLPPGQSNAMPSSGTGGLSMTDTTSGPFILGTAFSGSPTSSPLFVVGNPVPGGDPQAVGTFTGGTGIVGFERGVVLSTGKIADARGPNAGQTTSTNFGLPGDADLESIVGAPTHDAASVAFDFCCGSGGMLTMSVVFASEEFTSGSTPAFDDAFGIFLSINDGPGTNIAMIPSTGEPISVDSLTCKREDAFKVGNCHVSIPNDCAPGVTTPCTSPIDIELDGLSSVMTVSTPVPPGTHSVKIVIADTQDSVLDSVVFVRGGLSSAPAAPFFEIPTGVQAGSAGTEIAFDVSCVAGTGFPGNRVTLDVIGLPPGATMTPPLPLTAYGPNATAVSRFSWIPGSNQVGQTNITFLGTDQMSRTATIDTTLLVAECMLFLGLAENHFPLGPETDDILLLTPLAEFPVTMEQFPTFSLPSDPTLQGSVAYAQVGMYNPFVFPTNPLQMSNGLRITLGVGTEPYGATTGIDLHALTAPALGTVFEMGFTIQGL